MAATECTLFPPTIHTDDSGSHLSIASEGTSSQGDCHPDNKKCETGLERLIEKKPTTCPSDIHIRASRPPTYLGFSILVAMVCNCPVGGVAVAFSCLSERSYSQGRHHKAKIQGNIAKWLNIVGIAITTVAIAFIVVYFVFINSNIVDTVSELRETIKSMTTTRNSTVVAN